MLHLMNSAMMPQEGNYECKAIATDDVQKYFAEHCKYGWRSYIGYANAARVLSSLLEMDVSISQDETVLADGDCCLAMRLNKRVADKTKKAGGQLGQNLECYQFFGIAFRKE